MSHGGDKGGPAPPPGTTNKLQQLLSDLLIGGTIGAISKTVMAPVERVKLLMQTQDSNPAVLRGEVERYKGIGDCFTRVKAEQGIAAFWRGNLVNCLRYAPQQGCRSCLQRFSQQCLSNLQPQDRLLERIWC